MKTVIVLGSTGSIGTSTLDIVRRHPDLFRVVALSAHTDITTLERQIKEFRPLAAAMAGTAAITPLPGGTTFFAGADGLLSMIKETDADIVVNGIAGSAGMLSSFAAIESGKALALANKETIVMAGPLLLREAAKNNLPVIPVDSEHSAIFHLLGQDRRPVLEEIILTASGGAFRDLPKEKLEHVALEDALNHPNWDMGPKITIDSSTMANKALEVIEANLLFHLPLEKIRVVIHPQSFVHSLIRTTDGSLYAQLSRPDMRIPIQNALTWPDLLDVGFGRLDIEHCTLEFRPVDFIKYPLLALGYSACREGGALPTVFNAANEEAVAAFISREIRYNDIAAVVEEALSASWTNLNTTLDDVILNDTLARQKTREILLRKR
ncbi:MAG: 1-deoxy-D-xylulose-5-phosphate reductoisomerase [Spirochaetales bacterium]|nr:1-deoxy-D-xylulose-5-phosphate reductoisomerase [Spirochaetales bacterium]